MDAADFLRQVGEQPRFELEVRLLLDAAAFAEARELNDRLSEMRADPDGGDVTTGGLIDVAQRLVELHDTTQEQTFLFRARNAYEWEQLAKDNQGEDFTLALFAECCVEPSGWTVDAVRDLKARLTFGQWAVLIAALRQVNEGLFDLRPTKAATTLTRGTRPKSTTAHHEESEGPSS